MNRILLDKLNQFISQIQVLGHLVISVGDSTDSVGDSTDSVGDSTDSVGDFRW